LRAIIPKPQIIYVDDDIGNMALGDGFDTTNREALSPLVDHDKMKIKTADGKVITFSELNSGKSLPTISPSMISITVEDRNETIETNDFTSTGVNIDTDAFIANLSFDLATESLSQAESRKLTYRVRIEIDFGFQEIASVRECFAPEIAKLVGKNDWSEQEAFDFELQYGDYIITQRSTVVMAEADYTLNFDSAVNRSVFLAKFGAEWSSGALNAYHNKTGFELVKSNSVSLTGRATGVSPDVFLPIFTGTDGGVSKGQIAEVMAKVLENADFSMSQPTKFRAEPLIRHGIDLQKMAYGDAGRRVFNELRWCAVAEHQLEMFSPQGDFGSHFKYATSSGPASQCTTGMLNAVIAYKENVKRAAEALQCYDFSLSRQLQRPGLVLPRPFVSIGKWYMNTSTQVMASFTVHDEMLEHCVAGQNGAGIPNVLIVAERNNGEVFESVTDQHGNAIVGAFSGGGTTVNNFNSGAETLTITVGHGNSRTDVMARPLLKGTLKGSTFEPVFP